MLEWVRPRAFLPVHGTLHHLLRHAELARDLGVSDAISVENGTPAVKVSNGTTKMPPAIPRALPSAPAASEPNNSRAKRVTVTADLPFPFQDGADAW